ncbi:MAG: PEP-CTERM sorting domain-containing protein [Phycisphaerales bacterium]|nr:PEP-CTERM sorting domain-containing protein [Phycisphaerales bacterium]
MRLKVLGYTCVIGLAATGVAAAGVVTTPDPGGYTTHSLISGSAGTPAASNRWFLVYDSAAYATNWANENIHYALDIPDLGAGADWRLGLTARNHSPLGLPSNYSEFKVEVRANNVFMGTVAIPAFDEQWATSWLNLGSVSGPVNLQLRWKNDSYKAGHYDANVAFGALQLATNAVVPEPTSLALATLGLVLLRRRR